MYSIYPNTSKMISAYNQYKMIHEIFNFFNATASKSRVDLAWKKEQ